MYNLLLYQFIFEKFHNFLTKKHRAQEIKSRNWTWSTSRFSTFHAELIPRQHEYHSGMGNKYDTCITTQKYSRQVNLQRSKDIFSCFSNDGMRGNMGLSASVSIICRKQHVCFLLNDNDLDKRTYREKLLAYTHSRWLKGIVIYLNYTLEAIIQITMNNICSGIILKDYKKCPCNF